MTAQLCFQRKVSPPCVDGSLTIVTLTRTFLLPYVVTLTFPVLRFLVWEQYRTSPRGATRPFDDLHVTLIDLSDPADDGVTFAERTTVVVPLRGSFFFEVAFTTSCASVADAV